MAERAAPNALVLLVGAVLFSGCWHSEKSSRPTLRSTPQAVTSNPSGLWHPTVVSECGNRLASPPRKKDGTQRYVFFTCKPRKGHLVDAAAARELDPRDVSPVGALRVLLRGPTRAERAAGFASTFSAETRDLPFRVEVRREQGLAVVDLDRSIMRVRLAFVSVQDSAQITSTVGQFPGVKRVRILVGGRPLCEVVGEC